MGASQFEEVESIAIHPSTKFIYELISGNTSSKILRVNALAGDAYLLHEIDLGTMAGIAFDKNETLYGVSILEKYTQLIYLMVVIIW